MRVCNKVFLSELCELKLDQQSFGLAKDWMAVTERLKSAEQTCLFLRRCLKENVTPTSFCRPCRIPQNLRTSTNIAKLQANLSRKLIRTAIRQKYQDIANLKESSNRLRDRIPLSNVSDVLDELQRTAQVEIAALAYALRWQAAMTSITHTAATTANTTTTTATTTTATTATTTTTNNATTNGDTEHAEPTPINISRKCPFKPNCIEYKPMPE